MGVMYYAEYFHLFERSRNEYIRNAGMSYADIEKKGYLLPVRDAQCRYRSPARYDDLVLIRAGISEIRRASLCFIYEIWNDDKERLLAAGQTQHALTNSQGKPVPIPDWLKSLLNG